MGTRKRNECCQERQIGETFDAGNGTILKVCEQSMVATDKCRGCYYKSVNGVWSDMIVICKDNGNVAGQCAAHFRKDKTNVVFKVKQS